MNRAAAAIPHWQELGRTTLGSGNTDITVSSFANKPYLMILDHTFSSLQTGPSYRFNSDTGTNYAYRKSSNGGADATTTSLNRIAYDATGDSNDKFTVAFVNNIATEEKLVIGHLNQRNSAGAGNAPDRSEFVGKWANTSNAITTVTQHNGDGNNYDTGSEVVVLGYDPADTTGTNFWQELASVELSVNGNLSTGTFTAKKYLWVQTFFKPTSANTSGMVMNNDTAYNYSNRRSLNGAADTTRTSADSLAGIQINGGYNEGDWASHTSFIINKSDKEKLSINEFIGQNTAGAANAPDRMESVGKWTNTSNQITEIDITDGAGAALTLTSGSFIKVWGAD